MVIYLVSGSGNGAGKSALAHKLTREVWPLAAMLKSELRGMLPEYDWFSKSQSYKNSTVVEEMDRKTLRQCMVEYGQSKCNDNPHYWVEKFVDKVKSTETLVLSVHAIAIDDLRKLSELNYIREQLPSTMYSIVHFHVVSSTSVYEKEFQNDELAKVADYIVAWEK